MQPDLERSQRADKEPDLDANALDRYRTARAIKAEIDNEILLGKIVYRADLAEGFRLITKILLELGDTLTANHGPAAGDLLRESLSECESEIKRLTNVAP